jgi:hypothetical protein
MSNAERSVSQIITDFLQKSDRDIEIALDLEKALRGLREALAEEIGGQLEGIVRGGLQEDWLIDAHWSRENYSGLNVRRAGWPSGKNSKGDDITCWVGIEFRSDWKNPKFGVVLHKDIIPSKSRDHVTTAVRKEFPDLNSKDDWWAASRSLQDIPSDWQSNEFLNFARRVKRGDQQERATLTRFAEKLARICEIVDETLASIESQLA